MRRYERDWLRWVKVLQWERLLMVECCWQKGKVLVSYLKLRERLGYVEFCLSLGSRSRLRDDVPVKILGYMGCDS
jgi:hypothetical protein